MMTLKNKLQQIDKLKTEIDNKGDINPTIQRKIDYKFRLEWNYTSNSMEGNTLTKQETRSLMVNNVTIGGKPLRDILEVKGHDTVVKEILKIGKGELNLSENRIKSIHKSIIHEDDITKANQVGKWKTAPNYILNYENERIDFVHPSEVPEQMHQLINWLNVEKERIKQVNKQAIHPAILAFQFHLKYVTIHPFYDGNGRTARILTNLILISYGYPPLYIKEPEIKQYHRYISDVQTGGSPDLFFEFMSDLLLRSQQLVLDAVAGKDIDDADDVDKGIDLLKIKLAIREKEKIDNLPNDSFNQEKLDILWKECVKYTIEKAEQLFEKCKNLFKKSRCDHQLIWRAGDEDGSYDYFPTDRCPLELDDHEYKKISTWTTLNFTNFAGEGEDVSSYIEIYFSCYFTEENYGIKHSISFDENHYDFLLDKKYNEILSHQEIDYLFSKTGQLLLDELNRRLEQS